MKIKNLFTVLIIVGLLFFLYYFGMPFSSVISLGIVMILLVILKGKLYKKIDKIIRENFKFVSKMPEWGVKLIIVLIGLLIYIVLKQIVFEFLKIFGLDLQKTLTDEINRTLMG